MFQQMSYFVQDVKRMIGKRKLRILHIWLGRAFWGVFLYRLERGLFLLIGKPYQYVRVILVPIFNLIQAYSNIEIHYQADVKGGLLVLHPSVGSVVSGIAIVGKNLTLTGGNIIGTRKGCKRGDLLIGDGCNMGANAVILGPTILANNISVGASACVVRNCLIDGSSLVGVPAKMVAELTGLHQP